MNCCYSDEEEDSCDNRRLGELPMCAHHMRATFRTALVEGMLPADVFQAICQDAVHALGIGERLHSIRIDAAIAQARRNREAREREQKPGAVYYVRLTGDRIKIGWTTNLAVRLATYRSRPEDLLAVEPGPKTLEAERHAQFAAERLDKRLEDFEMSERLAQHIATLNAQRA